MATIMAGGSKRTFLVIICCLNLFKEHLALFGNAEKVESCQKVKMRCLVYLCFRGRDPSAAAAHRQKGGGCFQLSSYRVGKTNMLVRMKLCSSACTRRGLPGDL